MNHPHIKKVIKFNEIIPGLFGPYAYPYYWVLSEIESNLYSSKKYMSDRVYYIFKYTLSGWGIAFDGQKNITICPGSILLMKYPAGNHEYGKYPESPEPWKGMYFEFHAGALAPIIDRMIEQHGVIYAQKRDVNIGKKMYEFEKLWRYNSKTWFNGNYLHLPILEANSLILYLLSSLEPFEGHTISINTKLINSVCSYINVNLEKPLIIKELAKRFNISRGHMTRLFKKHLNNSPNNYIRTARVSRACDLMINSRMTNSEIAENVGINSIVQYHRLFKQITGLTPGEFRKSENKLEIIKKRC